MTLEELEAYLEEKGLKDKWKRNSKYWASRFELLEDSMNNKCNDYFYDLERIYTKAISETEKDILKWYNRFAKNEKITLTEAKQTLNKNDLKEFRMTLREYIEKGESLDPKWLNELERASIKVHVSRLEALKIQMQQQVESLMGNEFDSVDKLLRDIYTKSYYHTAFEIQKGIGVGWDLMKLDTNAINKVMSKPWTADGINFSERIWGKYRPELIKKIHDGLTINVIRGESSDKLINDITKAFEVKKSQAKNLVRTEKAFFMTTSQCDCFNDLGVKEYEIVATLDNKTSEICRAIDGKVFEMKDFQAGSTAPPFHNQCRSTTAPYFNDEFTIDELRAARDEEGKYYTVPSSMKYPEWYKAFVESDKSDIDIFDNYALFKYRKTLKIDSDDIKENDDAVIKLYSDTFKGYAPSPLEVGDESECVVSIKRNENGTYKFVSKIFNGAQPPSDTNVNIGNNALANSIHERAHDIINQLALKKSGIKDLNKISYYQLEMFNVIKRNITQNVYVYCFTDESEIEIKKVIKESISERALYSGEEFISEALVQYFGGDKPSKLSKKVYNYVIKEWKKYV